MNFDDEELNLNDINVEKELKIIFMGTPLFSVPVLEALIANYHVKAIVTQPDEPVGRKAILTPSPIKEVGNRNTILVLQPAHIKTDYQEIIDMNPDLIVTCAYGQIIPKEILDCPRLGCINVHASLLPKLRGGAPIQRAIMDGYNTTGVTIMYMAPGMDDGDIIEQKEIPIEENDTYHSLHDKLSILGRDLLMATLPSIINGTNKRIKQNDIDVTYGFNIKREDEHISYDKTTRQIYNQIRGLNNHPGAYSIYDSKILKVWASRISDNYEVVGLPGEITNIYKDGFGVKTTNGEIVITEVQPEGKKQMRAVDFINGEKNKGNFIGKMLS